MSLALASPRASIPAAPSCEELPEELRLVEACLLGSVAAATPFAREACAHLIRAGGKRLRPTLLLLSARLGPRVSPERVLAAAAVELLHLATLYHDDIVDQSSSRRGVASVNAKWGNQIAAFAGGLLFSKAATLFARIGGDVNRLAADAAATLWRGQMREIEGVDKLDLDEGTLLEIVAEKTGALYELPCRLGAILGGASEADQAALAEFGRGLGVAFQLVDDIMDIVSDATTLGKEPGADLREGIYTLPVIYALASPEPTAGRLRAILELPDLAPRDLAEARTLLVESGSIQRTAATARAVLERAKMLLPRPERHERLRAVADSIVDRIDDLEGVGA